MPTSATLSTCMYGLSLLETTIGAKNGNRRHVRTGGKEKNRFTAQLSITKDGRKLIPFLIFGGEYALWYLIL